MSLLVGAFSEPRQNIGSAIGRASAPSSFQIKPPRIPEVWGAVVYQPPQRLQTGAHLTQTQGAPFGLLGSRAGDVEAAVRFLPGGGKSTTAAALHSSG